MEKKICLVVLGIFLSLGVKSAHAVPPDGSVIVKYLVSLNPPKILDWDAAQFGNFEWNVRVVWDVYSPPDPAGGHQFLGSIERPLECFNETPPEIEKLFSPPTSVPGAPGGGTLPLDPEPPTGGPGWNGPAEPASPVIEPEPPTGGPGWNEPVEPTTGPGLEPEPPTGGPVAEFPADTCPGEVPAYVPGEGEECLPTSPASDPTWLGKLPKFSVGASVGLVAFFWCSNSHAPTVMTEGDCDAIRAYWDQNVLGIPTPGFNNMPRELNVGQVYNLLQQCAAQFPKHKPSYNPFDRLAKDDDSPFCKPNQFLFDLGIAWSYVDSNGVRRPYLDEFGNVVTTDTDSVNYAKAECRSLFSLYNLGYLKNGTCIVPSSSSNNKKQKALQNLANNIASLIPWFKGSGLAVNIKRVDHRTLKGWGSEDGNFCVIPYGYEISITKRAPLCKCSAGAGSGPSESSGGMTAATLNADGGTSTRDASATRVENMAGTTVSDGNETSQESSDYQSSSASAFDSAAGTN